MMLMNESKGYTKNLLVFGGYLRALKNRCFCGISTEEGVMLFNEIERI